MIAFCVHGEYSRDPDGGVREWCYDADNARFVTRWRRWASDPWTVEAQMAVPDFHSGASLLNALAHAHPDAALRVAEHLGEHGPRRVHAAR